MATETVKAKEFSASAVYKAIAAALPEHITIGLYGQPQDADVRVLLTDERYYAIDKAAWADVLKAMPPRNKYLAERYDCDAYSRWFFGYIAHTYEINALGMCVDFSGHHAYNLICVWDGADGLSVEFVEPQLDKVVPLGSNHHILTEGFIWV